MNKIIFATTNDRKLREACSTCDIFNISVEQLSADISEIQHDDHMQIACDKAQKAFDLCGQKPVVITDTLWNIPALNGFPGSYSKDIAKWFTPADFLVLIKDKSDRRISFTEVIVYKDKKTKKIFKKEYWGVITAEPRGTGNSLGQIAEFNGSTISEMYDRGGVNYDPKEYIWYEFADWFSKK